MKNNLTIFTNENAIKSEYKYKTFVKIIERR